MRPHSSLVIGKIVATEGNKTTNTSSLQNPRRFTLPRAPSCGQRIIASRRWRGNFNSSRTLPSCSTFRWLCSERRHVPAPGLVALGHSIRVTTLVSAVNRSTCGCRTRPKPPGIGQIRLLSVAHAIGRVHEDSRGTYGRRCVAAALRIERDLPVNHTLVSTGRADFGRL